jgi:Asp-tRNA(Asn)/Glu-tRNA(Gln) amidotransferase C subunit
VFQHIARLVDRADKHVQSLKTKAFDEFTPEDIGHVCADLEGIIVFVRTCQDRGVFSQDERMALLESKFTRTDEWQRKFEEKLQIHTTNELRIRELIEENQRLRNELDEIPRPPDPHRIAEELS